MPRTVHQAQLSHRRTIAQDTEEYLLRVAEPAELRFRPGQFISVTVGARADGHAILRSYSIASSPGAAGTEELTLILRLIEGGVGSQYFAALRPGDPLRFTGPMGFFVNDLSHAGDVVYGATGTGITPLVPMLREVLARPEPGQVYLHWGMRSEADLFWQEEIAALAQQHARLHVFLYLSRPGPAWSGLRGHITAPLLQQLPQLRQPVFYLCGNGQMIRDVKALLQEQGVDRKRQIRTEAFFS